MKKQILSVHVYLATACRKNVAYLYNLRIQDSAAVREGIKEIVDKDNDCHQQKRHVSGSYLLILDHPGPPGLPSSPPYVPRLPWISYGFS